MRPVNLIPPDDRRGRSAPARAGQLPNLLIGGLALLLLGVTMVVLTGNTIADRKSKVASLERQEAEIEARAQTLSSFVSLEQVRVARRQTLASLAESRFDWERVMRELSLVLPDDVELETLAGSVSPDASAGSVGLRTQVAGPALEIVGCAGSHQDVAYLAASLEDIDGVTRVAVETSEQSEVEGGEGGSCTHFAAVVGFDAVPAAAAPDATTPAAPPTSTTTTPTQVAATTTDGGVAAAEETRDGQEEDLSTSEGRVKKAKELIP